MNEDKELEAVTGTRVLVITLDVTTGEREVEEEGWAAWELSGIARWLHAIAEEHLLDDEEEDGA